MPIWGKGAVQPLADEVVRVASCKCGCLDFVEVVGVRRGGWNADGGVVSHIAGYRAQCQDCGQVYAIRPEGRYTPHQDAVPFFGGRGTIIPVEAAKEPMEPRPPRSVPRKPPSV